MSKESSTIPKDMEQDLLEREKRLHERERLLSENEAELDASQKVLDEKDQELTARESVFDRKELDLEWDQLKEATAKFNETELGMRILALEENEKKLKMKKQELKNWSLRIQACRDNYNSRNHFGSCPYCQD
jgi:hypothetical protein